MRAIKSAVPLCAIVITTGFVGCTNSPPEGDAGTATDTLSSGAPPLIEDLRIASDDVELAARMFRPAGLDRFPVVVMVAGSGDVTWTDGVDAKHIAEAFNAQGIGTLVYDKRGTGTSTGTFTNSDFERLGADAANVVRAVSERPEVTQVGFWGISQAGWVIPYALRTAPKVSFAILVSPPGVTPFDQVSFFLRQQARTWGLSQVEAERAEAMHRAIGLYYATGEGYDAAQKEVDRYRNEPWFTKVVTHPYWDEMRPTGELMIPQALADTIARRPGDFEIYRAPSSFTDHTPLYRDMHVKTLLVYGAEDQLVPIQGSQEIFKKAFIDHPDDLQIKVFEGADHNIQNPDGTVLPDYLAFIAKWAKEQAASRR